MAENPVDLAYQAGISYLAMTDVPEKFIPPVPVHVPGSTRKIQLQRSRMPRIVGGGVGTMLSKTSPLERSPRPGFFRTPSQT